MVTTAESASTIIAYTKSSCVINRSVTAQRSRLVHSLGAVHDVTFWAVRQIIHRLDLFLND